MNGADGPAGSNRGTRNDDSSDATSRRTDWEMDPRIDPDTARQQLNEKVALSTRVIEFNILAAGVGLGLGEFTQRTTIRLNDIILSGVGPLGVPVALSLAGVTVASITASGDGDERIREYRRRDRWLGRLIPMALASGVVGIGLVGLGIIRSANVVENPLPLPMPVGILLAIVGSGLIAGHLIVASARHG